MKLRTRLALTIILAGIPVLAGFWILFMFFQQHLEGELLTQSVLTYMQSSGRAACESNPQQWRHNGPWMPQEKAPGRPFSPDFLEPHENRLPLGNQAFAPAQNASMQDVPDDIRRRMQRPPFGLFAYDSQFTSLNTEAPQLAATLVNDVLKNGFRAERSIKDDFLRNRPMFPPHMNDGKFPKDHRIQEVLLKMPWGEGPCAYILARRPQPHSAWNDSNLFPPLQLWLFPVLFVLAVVLLSVGPIVSRTRQLTREVRAFSRSSYGKEISIGGNDEIGDLARAFREAGEEIRLHISLQEQRERTLRNFLDNTTHDVMIPLTVLQGHLSAMHERLNSDGEAEALSSAMGETQYIASLIHNLSVAARIEEGTPGLQWGPVNLNELLERVMGRHRPIARQKEISIDHSAPENSIWCDGDVTFIEQSLNNVVYNAIRHNRSGGHVAVILESRQDGNFVLKVIDDGPGIPNDELERLLERCRSENPARSREPGRHGLGLRIACRLVTMHKWSFSLKRSEYGGLQVEFCGQQREAPKD